MASPTSWEYGKHIEHKLYIAEHAEDLPEVRHWQWGRKTDGRERFSPASAQSLGAV
jgi:hypothetical protein